MKEGIRKNDIMKGGIMKGGIMREAEKKSTMKGEDAINSY
jgi:hypothetical protein